jgi:predicted permease
MGFFSRKKPREDDIERELRAHLDLETEEQREAGLSPQNARYSAQRALGNSTLIQESVREVWNWNWLESLAQDFRYSFRSLRGSPVFALVAISSLGLAIGANTAIFSFVNALLLKHLPVPEPSQLVQIAEYEGGDEIGSAFSFPFIQSLDKDNSVLDGVAGRFPVRVNLTAEGSGAPFSGEVVTGDYFRTLRVKPALGRLLTEDDVQAGAANPVCVISYSLWKERFAGDPNIIGRKLPLNAHPFTVVGVTEQGFFGPQLQTRVDLQIPVSLMDNFMGGFFSSGAGEAMWKSADFIWLQPLARLKPGMSLIQAQAAIQSAAHAAKPKAEKSNFRLSDGSQGTNGASNYAKPITILMSIVALVLLIACANLAGLLLARANFRAKEFAVRLSLGASRWRVLRQLMVESLVIAACGNVVGLLLASWIVHTLLAYLNTGRRADSLLQASPDALVIAFSISLSLLTALLFGLIPSWQSARPDLIPALKGSSTSSNLGGLALRKFLIVFQIALSVVILFGAGLLTRTLSKLQTIDLGFDPARIVTLSVDPAMNGHRPAESDRIFDDILNRLRTQPGVRAASLSVVSPLTGGMIPLAIDVPGHVQERSDRQANFNMVTPDYFKTLNQTMLAGRDFDLRDSKKAAQVAIVNDLFVQHYMPGQDPIGRHFKVEGSDREITGLVKNVRYQSLREQPGPAIYLPVAQTMNSGYTLLVRTDLPWRQAIAQIQSVIHSVDPKLPISEIQELQQQIDQTISSERVLSFLSALFSVLATLLCSLGIYGLIAYAVSRRTREIGIRFAIGAQKSDVARLFLRESVFLVLLGVAAGIPLALMSTRALKSLLFGVASTDVSALVWTIAIFLATGLLASLIPVLKAARIEPLEALHYE